MYILWASLGVLLCASQVKLAIVGSPCPNNENSVSDCPKLQDSECPSGSYCSPNRVCCKKNTLATNPKHPESRLQALTRVKTGMTDSKVQKGTPGRPSKDNSKGGKPRRFKKCRGGKKRGKDGKLKKCGKGKKGGKKRKCPNGKKGAKNGKSKKCSKGTGTRRRGKRPTTRRKHFVAKGSDYDKIFTSLLMKLDSILKALNNSPPLYSSRRRSPTKSTKNKNKRRGTNKKNTRKCKKNRKDKNGKPKKCSKVRRKKGKDGKKINGQGRGTNKKNKTNVPGKVRG